jgi:hypothetical protein
MSRKIIAFDLDDVICKRDIEGKNIEKYKSCVPIDEMIEIVNTCYDTGNYVIIYTARGMNVFNKDVSKIYENLYDLTTSHLRLWGVKYHELIMGKIHYDILIDDKAINSLRIKSQKDILNFFQAGK